MPLYEIGHDGLYLVNESLEDGIKEVILPEAVTPADPELDEDCLDAIDGRVIHANGFVIMSERDYGSLWAKIQVLRWHLLRFKERIEDGKTKKE